MKSIKRIASFVRQKMEKQCGSPKRRCHAYADALVEHLKLAGFYTARKVTVIVFYDDYYAKGKKRDEDGWNPHQVAMIRDADGISRGSDLLIDIAGDQFNGYDEDGWRMITSRKRMIPPVNIITWAKASGGKRPVYGFEDP